MQADEPKASDGPMRMATARLSIMRVVIATDDTSPSHAGKWSVDCFGLFGMKFVCSESDN
jgi:hypothetical protein